VSACAQRSERTFAVYEAALPTPAPTPEIAPAVEPDWPVYPEKRMPPMKNVSAAGRRCLAKTIYFEARNESLFGQMAVAAVVLNRVRHPKFPDTICGVVHQGGEDRSRGCQFSWWCDGRSDTPREKRAWADAKRLAKEMIAGLHPDRTGGALFYHNRSISPSWSKSFHQTAEIDQHVYYQYQ
jgi:spore germination cell wall hydrolase CwlJ-like protein